MVFEVSRQISGILVAVFVVSSLFNVGLTQKPSNFRAHLKNGHFLSRMVLANLILFPAVMVMAVTMVDLEPAYSAGLLIFGLSAGAPFLIALTRESKDDVSLAATVMTVLIVGTVVLMPLILPRLIEGVSVDVWAIIHGLTLQMILPMILGMVIRQYLVPLAAAARGVGRPALAPAVRPEPGPDAHRGDRAAGPGRHGRVVLRDARVPLGAVR